MKNTIKKHWWLILSLLILAAWFRLFKLDVPLADWHSWRQADTASVTREFVQQGHPIWEPHYHDLSNIPSGEENPQGYRLVEFPLINYLVAQVLIIFPELDLVVTSRLTSIIFSLLSLISLYGLVYTLSKRRLLAWLTGLMWAILPYNVFYSRVILPEPAMIGMQLLSLWFFVLWLQEKNKSYYLVSLFTFALSLLLKPTAVFIAPVYAVLSFTYLGLGALASPWLWAYVFLGAAPVLAWRHWIQNFPTGIPASHWLLNGNDIRLRPAWWRWLFYERLGQLILGAWGTILVFLGLAARLKMDYRLRKRFEAVTLTWTFSMVAYLVIFATGNVQHDYYQTLLMPLISLLLARGLFWIFTTSTHCLRRLIAWPLAFFILGLGLFFSWWEVRGYYQINNPAIVAAGKKVAEMTPADSLVVAPYGGDTAFLFQTQRRGWPIGGQIETRIEQGADYYVTTTQDEEAKKLMKQYPILTQTEQYLILKFSQD